MPGCIRYSCHHQQHLHTCLHITMRASAHRLPQTWAPQQPCPCARCASRHQHHSGCRARHRVSAAAAAGAASDLPVPGNPGNSSSNEADSRASSSSGAQQHDPQASRGGGPLQWLRARFGSSKLDKQKLAEYGLGAFAAYGVISNLNAGVLVTISWLTVVRQTGLTPLDAGMWPRFLGVYAGLYLAVGSILRPLRLTLALAIAPAFNKALDKMQSALRVNKAVTFGAMLACIAASSFTLIACMLVAAGGFPNGPPQLPLWARR